MCDRFRAVLFQFHQVSDTHNIGNRRPQIMRNDIAELMQLPVMFIQVVGHTLHFFQPLFPLADIMHGANHPDRNACPVTDNKTAVNYISKSPVRPLVTVFFFPVCFLPVDYRVNAF